MNLIFLFALFSQSSLAGVHIVGNGGDVVVCKNEQKTIVRIELLDHFEAQNYRNQVIALGAPGLPVADKISIALNRLQKFSPERAEKYKKWSDSFFEEAQLRDDLDLVDIPDSEHSVLPKGCEIAQIANQATLLLPGQKRYTIDVQLWNLLNNDQKAGLILHEIVYREALSLNHNNSIAARFFAALIASTSLEKLTLPEFAKILKDLDFQTIRAQGVLLNLAEGEFDFNQNGSFKSGAVVENSEFLDVRTNRLFYLRHRAQFDELGNLQTAYLAQELTWKQENFSFQLAPQVLNFYPNGGLARAVLASPCEIKFGDFQIKATGHLELFQNLKIKRAKIDLSRWQNDRINQNIVLYENGNPEYLNFVDTKKINLQGQWVQIRDGARFFENGLPQEIYLVADVNLKTNLGSRKTLRAGTHIILDTQGFVVE